jgi:hypothetical protein
LGTTVFVEQSVPDAEHYQKRADGCQQEAAAVQDLAEREALCVSPRSGKSGSPQGEGGEAVEHMHDEAGVTQEPEGWWNI